MNKIIIFLLFAAWGAALQAQTSGMAPQSGMAVTSISDAERARITIERTGLNSRFAAEDAACHRKFLVNECLDKVKIKRREALADLRRQEISLDAQDRKAKGAEQIRKMEDKVSPEKQQQEADRRAAALRDFESRREHEAQKNADRMTTQLNEKTHSDATANRIKGNQDKTAARVSRQTANADEVKKFNERQDKAKERQARHERDKRDQTKPPAESLPLPE